jgi:hypothetical protein
MPAAEALREPTMPTAGRASTDRFPCTAMSGGGSAIAARGGGYSGSVSAMKVMPSSRAAASSRPASCGEQMRPGRVAPPLRARSGNAASAARALPQCSISARNVRGPTFSLRIRRSQSSRSSSLRRSPSVNATVVLSPPLP